jgi:soluble lytic murein transglycosylase-like protein
MLKLAIALVFSSSVAGQALANGKLCEREMMRAATKYGVPVGMLYAVGLTETGRGESLHPYAMNIEGKASFDVRPQEAIARFHVAHAAGIKLIDIGCMQINHHYHKGEFTSVEQMFEPAANVDYAARFLKELKAREGTWTMAVARYHAGPDIRARKKPTIRTPSGLMRKATSGLPWRRPKRSVDWNPLPAHSISSTCRMPCRAAFLGALSPMASTSIRLTM